MSIYGERFKSIPDDKIVALTNVKVFADDKFHVAKMMISVFDTENIVGNGENAGNQHFLLFPQSLQSLIF